MKVSKVKEDSDYEHFAVAGNIVKRAVTYKASRVLLWRRLQGDALWDRPFHTRGTFKKFLDWQDHILPLFNIVSSCNWNALGPAFLQSSNFIVEELLILLFQPAIHLPCIDNVFSFKSCAFAWGTWTHLIHGFLGLPESIAQPKQHLDRFSRFCRTHDSGRLTIRLQQQAAAT